MRCGRLLVLGALLLTAPPFAALAAPASEAPPLGDVVPLSPEGHLARDVHLVVTGERVLAVWMANETPSAAVPPCPGCDPAYDFRLHVAWRDAGEADWTPPRAIPGAFGVDWISEVLADEAGNVLVLYTGLLPDSGRHRLLVRSADGGASWGAPVDPAPPTGVPGLGGDLALGPAGEVYLTAFEVFRIHPFEAVHRLMRSTDAGASFQEVARQDYPPAAGPGIEWVASLTATADGRVLLGARAAAAAPYVARPQAAVAQAVPAAGVLATPVPVAAWSASAAFAPGAELAVADGVRVLALYREDGLAAPTGRGAVVARSDAAGLAFGAFGRLDDEAAKDVRNAPLRREALAADADGRVVAAWWQVDRATRDVEIGYAASTDGGLAFSAPGVLATARGASLERAGVDVALTPDGPLLAYSTGERVAVRALA